MRKLTLNRRTFLRGAAGVSIALPTMEIMLGRRAWAQAAPKRYILCFAGMSLGRDNAGRLTDIVPDAPGPGFAFKPPMAALQPLKDDVIVVSNLNIPIGGPGGRVSGFHKSSLSPLLCGNLPPDISPNCYGTTSDQVVANSPNFVGKTKFPFLNYRVQAEAYRGGGNVGVISWRARGQKIDPTVSPSLAFNNVFTGVPGSMGPAGPTGPTPAEIAAADRLRREELSVLDMVRGNSEKLRARLGRPDQIRLERHFDEIRDLERRLATIPGDTRPPPVMGGGPSGCGAPAKPGADPAVNVGAVDGSGEVGYAGEEQRAQVMTSLIAKAFACDLARVATLQYTCAQCFMSVEQLVGVKMDLHELAHLSSIQGGKDVAQAKVMEMYGWHMKHFAALATQLKAEIGPDGKPVLDNTALVFVNEGGLGPAEGKNPASHSTENMMVVVAGGKNLGLKPGRHIVTDREHPAKVVASAMSAAGAGNDGLGEVRGRLEAMFTG